MTRILLKWVAWLYVRIARLCMPGGRRASGADAGVSKFAIVSYYLPPMWSGGAVVLGRILSAVAARGYCFISRFAYDQGPVDDFMPRLPVSYHHVPGELYLPSSGSFLRQWFATLLEIGKRAYRIAEIVRMEDVRVVVATTGDLVEAPAAFIAARVAGARFTLYVFDDFVSQWWQFPLAERMAAHFERQFADHGAGFIVPNEFMARELCARYGVASSIVRNPTATAVENDAWVYRHMDSSRPIAVLYTGAVYAVNQGTLQNVLDSLDAVATADMRLILYTAQQDSLAESQPARRKLEVRGHVPPSAIGAVQENADILLLPFTFAAAAEALIRTSATAKLADYLASGRPLLAVAPRDTFLVDYLEANDCGFVCTSDEPDEIAATLRGILADQARCAEICANARRCAARDFSPAAATTAFLQAVAAGR